MNVDSNEVIERVEALKGANMDLLSDRLRVRYVMNGGTEGIYATLVWDQGKAASSRGKAMASDLGVDMPTVNLIASGLERLAQQVGVAPSLRTPYGPRDSNTARRQAEKRERIVEGWDYANNLDLHYPQIGRWLPGYTFTCWTICDREYFGEVYPYAKLHNPYDVFLGRALPYEQPSEIAIVKKVPLGHIMAKYPRSDWATRTQGIAAYQAAGRGLGGDRGWDGERSGVDVYEYINNRGTYVVCPAAELVLDFVPNPLSSGPPFVIGRKISFDKPVSQYHHVFGLMSQMAKLNVLALIAAEDSVFRETNIIGEMVGETYERGRFAINEFEPGTRIEKPTGDQVQQIWAQMDRLERQVRISSGYDVQQDGQSPNSFATGMGMRELQSAAANNVREYQTVIRVANELLDSKRLEWAEAMHPRRESKVYVLDGGRQVEETYTPATDIDGNYRTIRKYGMMASWDEGTKLVGGLQLLQAQIIDPLTMQENLSGVDAAPQINDRIAQHRAYQGQMAAVEQMAAQGDPRAALVLVEIAEKPQERMNILKKYFTPQEPQMSPEEAAMAGMGEGGMPGLELGPDASVQTVLSQLEQNGGIRGGVQTVGVRR